MIFALPPRASVPYTVDMSLKGGARWAFLLAGLLSCSPAIAKTKERVLPLVKKEPRVHIGWDDMSFDGRPASQHGVLTGPGPRTEDIITFEALRAENLAKLETPKARAIPNAESGPTIRVPPRFVPRGREGVFDQVQDILPRVMRNTGLYGLLARMGYDPVALVLAMIKQESNFDKNAESRTRAKGLMQVMPQTFSAVVAAYRGHFSADIVPEKGKGRWAKYGDDVMYAYWPTITAGVLLIKELLEGFIRTSRLHPGQDPVTLTIAAYNAGPGDIEYKMKAYHETMHYVPAVLKYYVAIRRANHATTGLASQI